MCQRELRGLMLKHVTRFVTPVIVNLISPKISTHEVILLLCAANTDIEEEQEECCDYLNKFTFTSGHKSIHIREHLTRNTDIFDKI